MNEKRAQKFSGRFFLAGLSVLTGLLALGAPAIAQGAAPARAAAAKPTQVIVSVARTERIFDRLQALGTLSSNEQVAITAKVTETVERLAFEDGQRVKKGQLLAEMTSAEEQALLREVEAVVREAKEQLDRIAPLAKRGVSAESELGERRRIYQTAVARAEAIRSRLADRQIIAPFDGVVGLRRISVGALVAPGTLITTIDDDSRMKLDFSVPATFLASLAPGQKVEAKAAAFADRVFEGEIAAIDSRIDPVTRSIMVRAILPNPDGALRAGLLMTLEVLQRERDAVTIPEEAVVPLGRQNFVFVVDRAAESPVAERREVQLGSRNVGRVEIRSGLRAGEAVITDGNLKVRPGAVVEIIAVDTGDEPLAELLKQRAGAPAKNPS